MPDPLQHAPAQADATFAPAVAPGGARADVIVVLGCRIRAAGDPSTPALRRVARAAEAFRDGIAPRVLASGGRRWGEHVEAVALGRALEKLGVPRSAIALELCSLTTVENALFVAEMMREAGLRRAAVATCAWHAERALSHFRFAGIDAFALPAEAPAASPLAAALRGAGERARALLDASTRVGMALVLSEKGEAEGREAGR